MRRLDAEVLVDALNARFGSEESYSSAIPEPFTFIPEHQRTINLADGSITSPFLEMFGRPARDTGLESERDNLPTDAQRLHLLNSTQIQQRIEKSSRLKWLIRNKRGKQVELLRTIYLSILSRFPSDYELDVANNYYQTKGLNRNQATYDLVWALINTKEFLYRH